MAQFVIAAWSLPNEIALWRGLAICAALAGDADVAQTVSFWDGLFMGPFGGDGLFLSSLVLVADPVDRCHADAWVVRSQLGSAAEGM